MFSLTQPIKDPRALETRQRIYDACVNEGRASRLFGKRLTDCPRYVDNDMAISWRMGWRYKNEEMRKRRKHV